MTHEDGHHDPKASTTDTALRLARLLNTSPEFWMNLQAARDLYQAARALEAAEA